MTKYIAIHYVFLASLWCYLILIIYKMIRSDKSSAAGVVAAADVAVTVRHRDRKYNHRLSPGERLEIGRTADCDIRFDEADGLPLKIGCLVHKGDSLTFDTYRSCDVFLNNKSIEMQNMSAALAVGDKIQLVPYDIEIDIYEVRNDKK